MRVHRRRNPPNDDKEFQCCIIDTPTVDGRYDDSYAVLQHLEQALALTSAAGSADIAHTFGQLTQTLRWSQNPSYTRENCAQSLLDGYAYAALSGPDGPLHAAAPRGGFHLMGPDVLYPDHHHAPREVYLIFTGGVQWRLDQGDWFDVEPGTLLYHDAWQMHGMPSSQKNQVRTQKQSGRNLELHSVLHFGG